MEIGTVEEADIVCYVSSVLLDFTLQKFEFLTFSGSKKKQTINNIYLQKSGCILLQDCYKTTIQNIS